MTLNLQSYGMAGSKGTSGKLRTASPVNQWGWLPALSLTSACGILLVAAAFEGGRLNTNWGLPVFWIGLAVIFLPGALRQVSPKPKRRERIGLLIILAFALYFVQYLSYPYYFSGYDAYSHWRTAQDILLSGHLFQQNPLLPISSFYPGLEILTTALSSLTGLSVFASGTLVVGIVQLVFILSLYLCYEHLTGSAHIAGIATILYMANPGYLFFDMDFAYESLALPLAVFVLFVLARRSIAPVGQRKGLTLIIWLGLGAVVITHHVTSFLLALFLILWTGVFLVLSNRASRKQQASNDPENGKDRGGRKQGTVQQTSTEQRNKIRLLWNPGGAALLASILVISWLIITRGWAVNYLSPHIDATVNQIMQILTRHSAPRQLFHNPSGFAVPLWERIFSYVSVVLIVLGLPLGLWRIWQRFRMNALVLALGIGAMLYPLSQAVRLTAAGAETGSRATEFLFLGIALVLAIGIAEFWLWRSPGWRRSLMIMVAVGLLCSGQLILGSGEPSSLLPGPYLVSADARSIEPEGITAAEWANRYLGPGNRFAADRVNTLLMMTYGNQDVLTGANADSPIAPAYNALQVGPGVIAILQADQLKYLLVDLRLSTSLPYVGTYFIFPASGGQPVQQPISRAALLKFDNVPGVSRMFDSGNIIIYDVEGITIGKQTSPAPAPPTPTPKPARPKQAGGAINRPQYP